VQRRPDDTPPLVAAPRHLRRRPFHREIPDTLLVPLSVVQERVSPIKETAQPAADSLELAYRRKRLVALVSVVIVALSIPALIVALVLAG
jgi:hypothetical protein